MRPTLMQADLYRQAIWKGVYCCFHFVSTWQQSRVVIVGYGWMAPSMHHHCGAIIIYQTLSLEEGAVIESAIEANIEHG
jgi:hypothetical protein